MIRALEELIRVLAYGGIGMWAGFIGGLLASDRHRLVTTILDEAERDMPDPRRKYLRGQALQTGTVVLVMLAMLLTGLTWMQSARSSDIQERRDCETLAQVSRVLRDRTKVYREGAKPERRLWLDFRAQIAHSGHPNNPAVKRTLRSIDRFLESQQRYVDHLAANPYPTVRGECD